MELNNCCKSKNPLLSLDLNGWVFTIIEKRLKPLLETERPSGFLRIIHSRKHYILAPRPLILFFISLKMAEEFGEGINCTFAVQAAV